MTITPDNPAEPAQDEGVSPRTAAALHEAMERLLAGRPQRTDGRLVKDNLWKEAGVSRATMNRAHRVMADWDTRVTECGGMTPGEARKNDELTQLRAKLADRTREWHPAEPSARRGGHSDRRPAPRQHPATPGTRPGRHPGHARHASNPPS